MYETEIVHISTYFLNYYLLISTAELPVKHMYTKLFTESFFISYPPIYAIAAIIRIWTYITPHIQHE